MAIGRYPAIRAVIAVALLVFGVVFHHGLVELGGAALLITSGVQLGIRMCRRGGQVR
jgi:hypothetical protein